MIVFKSVVMNTIVTVMLLSFSNVDLFKFLSNFHFPRIKNKIPFATYKKNWKSRLVVKSPFFTDVFWSKLH